MFSFEAFPELDCHWQILRKKQYRVHRNVNWVSVQSKQNAMQNGYVAAETWAASGNQTRNTLTSLLRHRFKSVSTKKSNLCHLHTSNKLNYSATKLNFGEVWSIMFQKMECESSKLTYLKWFFMLDFHFWIVPDNYWRQTIYTQTLEQNSRVTRLWLAHIMALR